MTQRIPLILTLCLLAIVAIPIAAPQSAPQARADWHWSTWNERYVYVNTWYNVSTPASHSFLWQNRTWDLLPSTVKCTPGYVCTPGYLKVRYWVDYDLGWSYMQCPCGRIFRTQYTSRVWWNDW